MLKNNLFYQERIHQSSFDPTTPVDLVTAKLKNNHPELVQEYAEEGVSYTSQEIVAESRLAKKLLWTIYRSGDEQRKKLKHARDELFQERKRHFLSTSDKNKAICPTVI